ncbi:multidrug effflux MFS transporter [Brachybacterium halotolerans subsp. kimchii]|uniref:multidrug effflux MFS transporter n=1 Tax=Brachybacterium halotolerans TaxID=2795215 RepID=UPI001E5EFA9B|nr:multidrug effflux MFS transporter [Brachybacterium halotolerans]UEJ81162.1 multidrug effflux MFS transporter [Brachybacterium halotolerans subsp. kimchii]
MTSEATIDPPIDPPAETTARPVSSTPDRPAPGRPVGAAMLVTLAILAAVAPFGTDLYLSAFPAMTSDLATTATGVQLSLTAFLVGAGLGQIVFGPWSDRSGRMPPLLIGLVLFLGASIAAVLAVDVQMLVIARLLQGLGGAAGMVIGRAMILDRERGPAAARALNVMMMISGVAPVIAPLSGSLLAAPLGWRGLLGIVAALGLVALVATLLCVRETLPAEARAGRRRTADASGSDASASGDRASDSHAADAASDAASTGRTVWSAMLTRGYLGHVAAFGFGMAIMMAYISASPFVYQDMIGLGTVQYGLAFAVNAVGLMASSALSARLASRVSVRTLTGTGLAISTCAVLVILAFTLVGAPSAWLMVPLFAAIAPLGLVFGNATALALSSVPPRSTGSASALLGMLQFVLAGIVAGLVGLAGEDTTLPLALTMLVSALIALGGFALAGGRR